MNEFLNPKSMSTPGAAGALMMLIANALCNNFPEFPFRYVALVLSFAIGAVVFSATTMRIWERGIYWIVNSLIIFSMGVGATNIAANVAAKQATQEKSVAAESTSVAATVMSIFVRSAFGQDNKNTPPPTDAPKDSAPGTAVATPQKPLSEAEMLALIKSLQAQVAGLQAANQSLQQRASSPQLLQQAPGSAASAAKARSGDGFFNRW